MKILTKLLTAPTRALSFIEHERQKTLPLNERSVEYRFVFNAIYKHQPQTILDVGTGTTALPALMRSCGPKVTAIDSMGDYWRGGMINRHYHVISQDITKPVTKVRGKFDMITCISTLEHIPEFYTAMENMMGLLSNKGIIVASFPYSEMIYVPNVYELLLSNAYKKEIPFICQSFSHNELIRFGHVNNQELWMFWTGSYWSCGDRITPPVKANRSEPHQLTCVELTKKE